ncbi:ATP-binding domain-containing protein [Deinococcus antarcticus]|uniref:ATP-binding domain-containing protein n=1 Tax=Deinococcus antarcticus TaxID=1298767 RepID=A0ABV8A4U5_9DEIO
MQNLVDYTMLPPEQLFGFNSDGSPRIEVSNAAKIAQDMILPVCYRNTPWALTIAHGLGFGTNRAEGLVQLFDDISLWEAIGYEVVSGSFEPKSNISLRRRGDAFPQIFKENLYAKDVILTEVFDDDDAQVDWAARSISRDLTIDELQIEDIMVIVSDSSKFVNIGKKLSAELLKYGVKSHLTGIDTNRDEFFIKDSVVITTIHRAKGNEAAMVYLINSEYGNGKFDLIKRRNTLYTGITRSRAWVRVCGVGVDMLAIKKEVELIIANDFKLNFVVPTDEERKKLRNIHRDRSAGEIRNLENIVKNTGEFIEKVHSGDVPIEALSQDDLARLREILERTREVK